MKRIWLVMAMIFIALGMPQQGYAGGPWDLMFRGGGNLNFTNPDGEFIEARLSWNIKKNLSTGEINGHLNIFERGSDGTNQHYRLNSDQIQTALTIGFDHFETSFECGEGQVQLVVILDADFHYLVASFDITNNTVSYTILDIDSHQATSFDPVELNGHMTFDCQSMESLPAQHWSTSAPALIYLPVVIRPSTQPIVIH
jgi:hypothetical protein